LSVVEPDPGNLRFSYATNAQNDATGVTQASDVSIAYPPGSLLQTASYNSLNHPSPVRSELLPVWMTQG
jgi:hypothetical protein